jgi:anaerobic selenocysteine-containing dehydrogenase
MNRDLGTYLADLAQGRKPLPQALLVYEANPVYALPDSETLRQAWESIPLKVSFSPFMDETARASDLLLPAPLFLERYDDAFTPFGSGRANYTAAQPVLAPVTDSRSVPDAMLQAAQGLDIDLGVDSYQALLREKASLLGASWSRMMQGHCWTDSTRSRPDGLQLWNQGIKAMLNAAQPREDSSRPLTLAADIQFKMGSAQTGIPPFGLKTLLEEELPGSMTPIRLNSLTAKRLGLAPNDAVRLSSAQGTCTGRVLLDEGVMPDVAAVPLGLGHTGFDEFSRNKGDNAARLFVPLQEEGSRLTTWSGTRLNIEKI